MSFRLITHDCRTLPHRHVRGVSIHRGTMSVESKAEKKASRKTSDGWNRKRMNKTHLKGKRAVKKEVRRARRRVSREKEHAETEEAR